jgi:hypothetical protein
MPRRGYFKERRSALASIPDKSLQEIADPARQGPRQPVAEMAVRATCPWTILTRAPSLATPFINLALDVAIN